MFAVTVELLTGRYVATEFNNRSKSEWPPHPARLFSAAVAAWADHGDSDDSERAALEWWETLEPPIISCSIGRYELAQRHVVSHFVPVNDTAVVSRDTTATYVELVEAEAAALEKTLDEKQLAKAIKRLEKARLKAGSDSLKATSGIAPADRRGILPSERGKQARMYPTIVPADPTVTYYWTPDMSTDPAQISEHLDVLSDLLFRVPRLGHSSTPVSITLSKDVDPSTITATLEPGSARKMIGLRVTGAGQVAGLIESYIQSNHATEPRTMPARTISYRRPGQNLDIPTSSIGERWIVLRPKPKSRFMVQDIAAATKTLRRALMSVAGSHFGQIPEFISGHQPRPDGEHGPTAPSKLPHLMVFGLPFVGHKAATGEVMAFALVLPPSGQGAEVDAKHWADLTEVVRRFLDDRSGQLTFGKKRKPAYLADVDVADLPQSASVERWSRPSRNWVSITPVALNRNPGNLTHRDPTKREAAIANAKEQVSSACEHIGLPRPKSVEITFDAPIRGTRPVHAFPPARTGKLVRVQVHTRLSFTEAVAGPIALGSGRFQGQGLFLPIGRGGTLDLEVVA